MRRLLLVLCLTGFAPGQGGRDGATGVLFVALNASVETDAIHRVAWRALEPHDVARRRMATFSGDMKKARAYLRANKDAKIVVSYDPTIAALTVEELKGAVVLRVYEEKGAHVHAWVDRARFYGAVGTLIGDEGVARSVESLTHFPTSNTLRFKGMEWAREGRPLPKGTTPVVATTGRMPAGRAVLTMRPDPRSLGFHVAAHVLRHLRTGKPFPTITVRRMRLTIDLAAARRAKVTVPLKLLAVADVVRRDR